MPIITSEGTYCATTKYNSNTIIDDKNNIIDNNDETYCRVQKAAQGTDYDELSPPDGITSITISNFNFSTIPQGATINNLTLEIKYDLTKYYGFFISDAKYANSSGTLSYKGTTAYHYTTCVGLQSSPISGVWNTSDSSILGTWTRDELQGDSASHNRGFTITIFPRSNVTITSHYIDFYYVKLTVDYTLPSHTISTVVSPANTGSVTGGGTYPDGTNVTLTATPSSGYKFVQWQDGNTTNPQTITVSQDITYTATFAPDSYTISTTVSQAGMGTVTGGGTYTSGSTVTLTATPAIGYKFLKWSDNNTSNPRSVTASSNTTYTAIFESSSQIYLGTQRIQNLYLGTTQIKKVFIGTKQIY